MSVYLDKHTTYKSWVRRDEFREIEPISCRGPWYIPTIGP